MILAALHIIMMCERDQRWTFFLKCPSKWTAIKRRRRDVSIFCPWCYRICTPRGASSHSERVWDEAMAMKVGVGGLGLPNHSQSLAQQMRRAREWTSEWMSRCVKILRADIGSCCNMMALSLSHTRCAKAGRNVSLSDVGHHFLIMNHHHPSSSQVLPCVSLWVCLWRGDQTWGEAVCVRVLQYLAPSLWAVIW